MIKKEKFLSRRQRYHPVLLPKNLSDEEMARDWTLLEGDQQEIVKYRKNSRLYIAIQMRAVRLYGRFLSQVHDLSPHIINYLGRQLDLPPSLTVDVPEREATYLKHRQNILKHLGFQKFDKIIQGQFEIWLERQAKIGMLPDELFHQAEHHLLEKHVLLPGPSVLERLIIHVCSDVHLQIFETVFQRLSPELRQAIDQLLKVPDGEQRSYFYRLKEYPPAASISSIQIYLKHYQTVDETGIDNFELQTLTRGLLGIRVNFITLEIYGDIGSGFKDSDGS